MSKILGSLLASLLLLHGCLAIAQSPKPAQSPDQETADSPAAIAGAATFEAAQVSSVHLLSLNNADAKELADSLSKIFDAHIKAGHLAIVGDSRTRRLVIRSSDIIYRDVRNIVEELDLPARKSEQAVVASPATEEQESLRRIAQKIKESKIASAGVATLQTALQEALQRDFAAQQQELRSELTKLRSKMNSLEALLEKREAQKNTIILRRIQALLSSQSSGMLHNKDPMFSEPTSQISQSFDGARRRTTPLHTNISLDANSFGDEITTILQAELLGEDGMQIFLDGKATSLSTTIPFQLSNTANRVEFEVASRLGKRAFVGVKLECEQASEDFWKRIVLEKMRLSITQEELDRASGNQMITKCVYLPKEQGKGLTWLVWDQVDAGVDVRAKSKELGDLVVTMTIARSESKPESTVASKEWQHSYGTNEQVPSYFFALAEYCRLLQTVGPRDPRAEETLRKLVANTASDQEIRAAAPSRQEELEKHTAAQKALSPKGESVVTILPRAMSILVESGRQAMEKWLASDPTADPSGQPSNFAPPNSSDAKAN